MSVLTKRGVQAISDTHIPLLSSPGSRSATRDMVLTGKSCSQPQDLLVSAD